MYHWVDDGLRDLGHHRKDMFDQFKKELDNRHINYKFISAIICIAKAKSKY
jgi:nicotinamide riboside kinase